MEIEEFVKAIVTDLKDGILKCIQEPKTVGISGSSLLSKHYNLPYSITENLTMYPLLMKEINSCKKKYLNKRQLLKVTSMNKVKR